MVEKLTDDLKELPVNKPVKLHNVTCVYCSTELLNVKSNEEHVIARRFVPKGKLENQWNLIVRVCVACNNKKSKLEDDIPAITMQPDLSGTHVDNDVMLAEESIRKSKHSTSQRTGKKVLDSKEELTLNAPFFGGTITFNLISTPQIDQDRAFELARLQIMAFFYWLTYDDATKAGRFWEGFYFPIETSSKKDWGSYLNKKFMQLTLDWEVILQAETAGDFFKVIIKKEHQSDCWSWALEWNKNYRVIGLFGDEASIKRFNILLGVLELVRGPNFTYRKEVPLSEEDDILFKVNI